MLGQGLAAELENEAPGKGGHIAVNLGIEKVAQPYETAGEGDGDAQAVDDPQEVDVVALAVLMGEPPDRKKQGYCASVAGKASFPGHENLEEALPGTEIVVRLIEDAMAQAGSHDGGNQHRAEQ